METTAVELARMLGGSLTGDSGKKITGVNELRSAKETDASFILSAKYAAEAQTSRAVVIISDSLAELNGKSVIKVNNAKVAYAKALHYFYPEPERREYTSERAVLGKNLKRGAKVSIGDFVFIGDNAAIGDGVTLYPGVYVGNNVTIGRGTIIYPNVSVYDNTEIGENNIIHAGTSIGADGFGFVEDQGNILKVPQIGKVKIGNYVEIGANCTIDRASFGATVIGDMVKIDNLVHIAHNVQVGAGTIIVAQTGIAGSTKIGMGCVIGGQVGIVDHLEIGNKVQIGSQAGVAKDLPDGAVVTGSPARPVKELRRAEAYMMKLQELFDRVKKLEEKNK